LATAQKGNVCLLDSHAKMIAQKMFNNWDDQCARGWDRHREAGWVSGHSIVRVQWVTAWR
jgi:hypothetical protein